MLLDLGRFGGLVGEGDGEERSLSAVSGAIGMVEG